MTKGQVEAAVTAAITQYERDQLGRGPREARTFVVQHLVLVRLQGILSPAELRLGQQPGGVELVKQVRSRLIESSRDELCRLVEENTGARVVSLHADISTRTGERVFIFTLDGNLEEALRSG